MISYCQVSIECTAKQSNKAKQLKQQSKAIKATKQTQSKQQSKITVYYYIINDDFKSLPSYSCQHLSCQEKETLVTLRTSMNLAPAQPSTELLHRFPPLRREGRLSSLMQRWQTLRQK